MIDKRMVTGIGIMALIMIAMPLMAIAQPSLNKLPYDIKNVTTQEVSDNLWACYIVYDDIELLFYDCVITDKKATTEQIKLLLEYKTQLKYDEQNKPALPNKISDKNMECWEYSKKIEDWVWVC